jgi:ribosomal protein S12 methylthiotransferase accessory factor
MSFIDLQTRTPKRWREGTHRTRSPQATLDAYRPLLPQFGITRLANVTGLDRIGLPVCIAVRPNSRALATSQGKGETLPAAMASAMMESIETWHAERVQAPLRWESYEALRREVRTVDPAQLPVRVDAAFYPSRPVLWMQGEDLVRGEPIHLPYELVAVNYVRQPGHQAVFLESSNGLASGNHAVEATVHGLCEVIERDAVTLWELVPAARRDERRLDLGTLPEGRLSDIVQTLSDKGVMLAAWDITTDVGLPCYTCTIVEDPDSPLWRPVPMFSGHGAHLDPQIALSRAIHEAIQGRLTAISGSRDDLFPTDYVKVGNRDDHARSVQAIRDGRTSLAMRPAALPIGECIEDDLRTLLTRLQAVGVDTVVAVDLSRPEIGIPVVKVVVPGLEPYHTPLYQPGARARRLQAAMHEGAWQ